MFTDIVRQLVGYLLIVLFRLIIGAGMTGGCPYYLRTRRDAFDAQKIINKPWSIVGQNVAEDATQYDRGVRKNTCVMVSCYHFSPNRSQQVQIPT